MKLPRRKFLHLATGAALPGLSRIARAQAYPTRLVRLIVPFGPAGATDITARLIGNGCRSGWVSNSSLKIVPAPEYIPPTWDGPHVGKRLVEGLRTLMLMPMPRGPRPPGVIGQPMHTTSTDLLAQQEADAEQKQRDQREANRTRLRPSSIEIARMEQAICWPARYLREFPQLVRTVQQVAVARARGAAPAAARPHCPTMERRGLRSDRARARQDFLMQRWSPRAAARFGFLVGRGVSTDAIVSAPTIGTRSEKALKCAATRWGLPLGTGGPQLLVPATAGDLELLERAAFGRGLSVVSLTATIVHLVVAERLVDAVLDDFGS